MEIDKLEEILEDEPGYRLQQVEKALYQDMIEDWSEATSLPLDLRKRLNLELPLNMNGSSQIVSNSGEVVKARIRLKEGIFVETVLMIHKGNRNTVCVSTQAGCSLGCLFCKTGELGFKRNLETGEIIMQVLFFARYLKKLEKKITNVVFMGMGEPFLNFDNFKQALTILNQKQKLGIGARHISVSTAGLPEGIRRLADLDIQVNLAISLNAPDNLIRSRIMPVNRSYPIEEVLDAADYYIKKTNRRIMFEYVLIKDINDDPRQARKLALLLVDYLCFVNLIPYNGKGRLKPPDAARTAVFKKILADSGINVTERFRFGRDIDAACGQLSAGSNPLP